ncbi:MAG: cytochrome C oxidase subunit IV family protein [Thiogranum sp.]|nr:cytochrome C oxidase subunit IV family protein [Thiogranum sp.]
MRAKTFPNAFVVWLILVLLTVATWVIGEAGLGGPLVVAVLLLSITLKGQLVADAFMGMRDVSSSWRWVVSGWLLIVTGLIGLAYWTGVH